MQIDPEFLAELHRKFAKKNKVQDKKKWGRSKKPPDPLVKLMEEQSRLLRAARARRKERYDAATRQHAPFRRLVASLKLARPETGSPAPGIVDADLAGLIAALGLERLPEAERLLALEECDTFIMSVSQSIHGTVDEVIPWMLPAGVRLSLTECQEALRLR